MPKAQAEQVVPEKEQPSTGLKVEDSKAIEPLPVSKPVKVTKLPNGVVIEDY